LAADESWLGAGLSAPDRYLGAIILTSGVMLPLAFLPVIEDAFALPKATFLRVAFGMSLVCLALALMAVRRKVLPSSLSALLICYLCLNVLAFLASTDPGRSLLGEYLQYQGVITVLAYLVFFYAGARVFQLPRMFKLLLWVVVAGGVPVAVYAIGQKLDLDPFQWSFGSGPPERAFSSIGQANALAAYLVLVIPLAVGLLNGATPSGRFFLVAAIVVSTAALAVTFSRAGYVALLVAVPIALLPVARHAISRAAVVRVLAAAAILTISILTVHPLRLTAGEVINRTTLAADFEDNSIQKRLGMWKVAGQIIIDRPLLGTGHETYPEMFSQYREGELPGFGRAPARPESPHNHYLAIASSTGVVALGLYVAIIGSVFYWVLVRRGADNQAERALSYAVCGALVGHLITDMFMTAETTSSWLFWLLMGAAAGLAGAGQDQPVADTSNRRSRPKSGRVRARLRLPPSMGVCVAPGSTRIGRGALEDEHLEEMTVVLGGGRPTLRRGSGA
jgi:O-antigen ligase